MILDRLAVAQHFEIWQPRWKDRKVLLAAHKVGSHNIVTFTKAPTLGTGEYYISGRDVHQCELSAKGNGKIACYEVPLSFLEPLERVDSRSQKQMRLT